MIEDKFWNWVESNNEYIWQRYEADCPEDINSDTLLEDVPEHFIEDLYQEKLDEEQVESNIPTVEDIYDSPDCCKHCMRPLKKENSAVWFSKADKKWVIVGKTCLKRKNEN